MPVSRMIYEGANGVQALDLVGRKLAVDGGKHVMGFFELVKNFCKENGDISEDYSKSFIEPFESCLQGSAGRGHVFHAKWHEEPEQCPVRLL